MTTQYIPSKTSTMMIEKNEQFIKLLLQSFKIDVSKYDENFLNTTLNKRINETHCCSVEAYCDFLVQNNTEVVNLIKALSICYSEFFRNSLTFSTLEHIILPLIVLKKKDSMHKTIRIWSAACAKGQESYSIAILLEEHNNSINEKINYRIFATDQFESQVIEAQKGQYNAASLDNLSLKWVNQWFTIQGDTYSVKKELKDNIDFSFFDLFCEDFSCPAASIFGDFDLVFCANMLFYYKRKYQEIILEKLNKTLAPGGFLITGETERDILLHHNFSEVFPRSSIFQKKS